MLSPTAVYQATNSLLRLAQLSCRKGGIPFPWASYLHLHMLYIFVLQLYCCPYFIGTGALIMKNGLLRGRNGGIPQYHNSHPRPCNAYSSSSLAPTWNSRATTLLGLYRWQNKAFVVDVHHIFRRLWKTKNYCKLNHLFFTRTPLRDSGGVGLTKVLVAIDYCIDWLLTIDVLISTTSTVLGLLLIGLLLGLKCRLNHGPIKLQVACPKYGTAVLTALLLIKGSSIPRVYLLVE